MVVFFDADSDPPLNEKSKGFPLFWGGSLFSVTWALWLFEYLGLATTLVGIPNEGFLLLKNSLVLALVFLLTLSKGDLLLRINRIRVFSLDIE